ncbi:MAG: fumarate hydratase [Syntrophomonadaceae bacterium]|nr:fumarate hydratase [Syntrophomonadaceae bacterium]
MNDRIIEIVSNGVVAAGSSFLPDKKAVYKRAIAREKNSQARWTLETILENAVVAEENHSPLCDDTGIPHLVLDVGPNCHVTGDMLESIKEGVRHGLRKLPGRPMAIKGDDAQRLDQSLGMDDDPGALEAAPILIRPIAEDRIRLHIMMFGGGPAIRAKTYRVFHKHSVDTVIDEIVSWATEGTKLLGCTPGTIAVGIGRSHYEATSMMLQALVDGTYDKQTQLEQRITDRVNAAGVGALGLGGNTTVLATFMKVGPQRASGVRIVCMRPCCCFEPRIATVELEESTK